MPDEDGCEEDIIENGGTTETAYRWKFLSSLVTGYVVIVYSLLALGHAFGLTQEPLTGGTWATLSLAFLTVLAYSVGVDTLKAAIEARN